MIDLKEECDFENGWYSFQNKEFLIIENIPCKLQGIYKNYLVYNKLESKNVFHNYFMRLDRLDDLSLSRIKSMILLDLGEPEILRVENLETHYLISVESSWLRINNVVTDLHTETTYKIISEPIYSGTEILYKSFKINRLR